MVNRRHEWGRIFSGGGGITLEGCVCSLAPRITKPWHLQLSCDRNIDRNPCRSSYFRPKLPISFRLTVLTVSLLLLYEDVIQKSDWSRGRRCIWDLRSETEDVIPSLFSRDLSLEKLKLASSQMCKVDRKNSYKYGPITPLITYRGEITPLTPIVFGHL